MEDPEPAIAGVEVEEEGQDTPLAASRLAARSGRATWARATCLGWGRRT